MNGNVALLSYAAVAVERLLSLLPFIIRSYPLLSSAVLHCPLLFVRRCSSELQCEIAKFKLKERRVYNSLRINCRFFAKVWIVKGISNLMTEGVLP
jgi:hypothetical protein